VKKSGKFDQDKAEKQLAQLKTNDIPVSICFMFIFVGHINIHFVSNFKDVSKDAHNKECMHKSFHFPIRNTKCTKLSNSK
jgi:penicillin-binding protein-related factor A (putative recombinase)